MGKLRHLINEAPRSRYFGQEVLLVLHHPGHAFLVLQGFLPLDFQITDLQEQTHSSVSSSVLQSYADCDSTYPLLLLELPQLHVFNTLFFIGLYDQRDLLHALRPLEVVDLKQNNDEKNVQVGNKNPKTPLPFSPDSSDALAAPSSLSPAVPLVWP